MGFANFETTHIDYVCVYCGNENLVIDDSFDEHGNYRGTNYYCTCDKAKLEQEMKRKMQEHENEKLNILLEYKGLLEHDKELIAKKELENKLNNLVRDYIACGELVGMSKEDFLNICEEAYNEWICESDEEDGEEMI